MADSTAPTFCTDTKTGTFAGTQPGTLAGAFTGNTAPGTHFFLPSFVPPMYPFPYLFPMLMPLQKSGPTLTDRPSYLRRVPCVGSDRLDLLRFASAKRFPDRPSWAGRTAGACPSPLLHAVCMFSVTEPEPAAIRRVFEEEGELSAMIESAGTSRASPQRQGAGMRPDYRGWKPALAVSRPVTRSQPASADRPDTRFRRYRLPICRMWRGGIGAITICGGHRAVAGLAVREPRPIFPAWTARPPARTPPPTDPRPPRSAPAAGMASRADRRGARVRCGWPRGVAGSGRSMGRSWDTGQLAAAAFGPLTGFQRAAYCAPHRRGIR